MSDVISLHGIPQIHVMLAGYIYHSLYPPKDGDLGSEWISMIKGIAYLVDDQGLYVEDQIIAGMTNEMCRKHVLFTRPSAPLQNYGGYIPTIQIERLRNRNILILNIKEIGLFYFRFPLNQFLNETTFNTSPP